MILTPSIMVCLPLPIGPTQRRVQLPAVQQIGQPPEPGEPFVGEGLAREPARPQCFIELLRAIFRPPELETMEDTGKFAKISPVGALVCARPRLHLQLATGHGLYGN